MKDFFRNAFALDDGKPCEPTPAQRAVIERVAGEVVRRRMAGPAIAFLEKRGSVDFLCRTLEESERTRAAGCCEGDAPKDP